MAILNKNNLKIQLSTFVSSVRQLSIRKKIFLGVVVILGLIIAGGIVYISRDSKKDQNVEIIDEDPSSPVRKAKPPEIKEKTGGDPAAVIRYHEQAISAWQAGDKVRAKELAQKGIDINDSLKPEQLPQIPNQMNIIFELSDISQGIYDGP